MKFPKDFFEDEYRSDFLVPQMMKRAWAAKLELLWLIIEICRRHDDRYGNYMTPAVFTASHTYPFLQNKETYVEKLSGRS